MPCKAAGINQKMERKEESEMNDYTYYKARHDECEFYDPEEGVCIRGQKTKGVSVCQMFTLTQTAQAKRYISAKQHGERIGIKYDASRIIYAGYPRNVRKLIDYFMRRDKK